MAHLPRKIVIQLISARVAGATVFRTNCSIPIQGSTFVSGPNVRSTLEILWGSLLTIFLCTWTAQHLSLPPPRIQEAECPKRYWRLRWIWLSIWRKLKWMLVAIVMPEFFVGKALGDLVAAYRSTRCKDMQNHAKKSGIKWTMTHAFYANMGGFILKHGPSAQLPNLLNEAINSPTAARLPEESLNDKNTLSVTPTALERFLCNQNGYWRQQHHSWVTSEEILFYEFKNTSFTLPVAVNAAHICVLMSTGLIQKLPSITENEIEDKSKEDLIVKAFALGQVTWFFIQLLVRKIKGLPCTQLEIAVLGFAVCTFIIYLLWLKKPKDIKVPLELCTARELTEKDRKMIVFLTSYGFFENTLYNRVESRPGLTFANDQMNKEAGLHFWFTEQGYTWGLTSEEFGFTVGAVLFGACHCIAWNFDFPTSLEQILWRVASVFTTAAMPIFYLSRFALFWSQEWSRKFYLVGSRILTHIVYGLYALCRIYILVELFRSLAYLPPDAFVVTWSASIPHLD